MPESPPRKDYWRWPTLLLWTVFFTAGLFPEYVFYWLREAGHVTTPHALVNSYHLLTLGLAGYLGYFTYQRCLESGVDPVDAHGKALQVGILALLAFLPVNQVLLVYQQIPASGLRRFVLAIGTAKLFAWLYLYVILVRYYFLDRRRVYVRMRSIFPSTAHSHQSPERETASPDAEQEPQHPSAP